MRIGVNVASHALNMGGGWKAAWWHVKALEELGHDLTIYVTSSINPRLRPSLHGLPVRFYKPGVEAYFDGFITLNHFGYAQPLAKEFNIQHIFFPNSPTAPPEGLTLTANSRYTASHIEYKWNRKAEVLYIPIEADYRIGSKENLIIHISRFAEPNEFADKGHRQMIQCMRLLQRELPEWRLLLAGTVEHGQDPYVDSLLEFARGLPVEFMFEPNEEEMRGLYAKAAIMWHCTGISLPTVASAQEHLGLSPLEASASGCVPIVYRSGGMPEVVKENQTGLLFDDVRQMGQLTIDLTKQLHTWAAFQQYEHGRTGTPSKSAFKRR
jgi:glycosyltransferase involved in cell wall biosynthesis